MAGPSDKQRALLSKVATGAEWARSALFSTGAQAAVQLLGFASGIVVIRSLSRDEYAYYTIGNTILGAMTTLTTSAVSAGVLAQAGRVWQDRRKLGAVMAVGLQLRTRLAIPIVLVLLPLLFLLLRRNGAERGEAILVTASIVPLFLATAAGQILDTPLRLHQALLPLQRLQLAANIARVGALAIVLRFLPFAGIAALCAAVPQAWANWRLRRMAARLADWHEPGDSEARARILDQVRRTMPATIYYTLSGQVAVWLISIYGRTESVAAVGALGRLAMILSAVGSVFNLLAIPRYARIPATEPLRLRARYWQAQGLLAFVCALPLVAIVAAPDAVLSVLGPQYVGLGREAALMAASAVVTVLTGAAFGLGAVRGVVAPPSIVIPAGLLFQAGLIAVLPIDTLAGVIWLGLLSEAGMWALHVGYFLQASGRLMQAPANGPHES